MSNIIDRLRSENSFLLAVGHDFSDVLLDAAHEIEQLRKALFIAEAALSDIGDADREDGDDISWCENRAAAALPVVRTALNGVIAQ